MLLRLLLELFQSAFNRGVVGTAEPGSPPDRGPLPGPRLDAPAPLQNAASFFATVRGSVFGGRLKTEQVTGTESILKAMSAAGWPISFAAYGLATAAHETNRTMQPIKEMGGTAYFIRLYDIEGARPQKARELGNLQPGDGPKYAGRGYVQLTGRTSYAKASEKLGVDLVGNPDLAMRPDIAARIMVSGMVQGWFTGKQLAHYLPNQGPATFEMFRRARRIINGTDRDAEIAVLALKFQHALTEGGWK